jgi:uncharacterized protein (TIGR02145 family)
MKNIIILGLFMCQIIILSAQIKVGNNPTTINTNSVLEVESTNRGLLMPRVALSSTNSASPLSAFVAGMLVYNTATSGTAPNNVTPGTYYCDGLIWIRVGNALDASKWSNNTTNTRIELTNLSNGTTVRPAGTQFVITDLGNVGISTTTPLSSAMLDLTSTNRGFLPPRMTNAQMKAIVSPVNGLMVYNTTLNCLAYHVNGSFNCTYNKPAQSAPNAPLGSTYTTHRNGIISGVHVGGTETLTTYTTGETFDQNTTCASKMISAQGCGGLTQVLGTSGTVYPLVNINGQCWMQTNLKEIPNNFKFYTANSWLGAFSSDRGFWGFFNNVTLDGTAGWAVSEPGANEGYLYQWSAAMDNSITERSRGACPAGFHVPSDCEWMFLEHGLGMSISNQVLSNMRGNNNDNEGTVSCKLRSQGSLSNNASGFSGLIGGFRGGSDGIFTGRGTSSPIWTSTSFATTNSVHRNLLDGRGIFRNTASNISNALSVRCLKD